MTSVEKYPHSRLRVAHIITDLATGGAQTMLYKLLQHIDKYRFDLHVISLRGMGDIGPRLEELGVPVITLHINPGMPSPLKVFKLVMALNDLKPDVVNTWMYHSDLLGGLATRLVGIRALTWGIRHTDLSAAANKRSTLWVVRVCAWLSHLIPRRILVNSNVARIVHESAGYAAEKIVVLPNGFDLALFVPSPVARSTVRTELRLSPDTPLVGVIGRFHSQKNQLGFVRAMADLHALCPDVHFLLAGYGVDTYNNVLVSALQAAGVTGVCHLLGLRTDIPRLMASLDVLALPSVGEAFPNVVGEAMACAVPCVVTDVGDSGWIVAETGRVVPVGDMSALAHAIIDLLNMPTDERAALGAAARERVARLFEIGAVAKRYEAFYESLVVDGV